MTPINPALTAASHVQGMAAKSCNEKLAFALTGLSCLLVGKMVYDSFAHTQRYYLDHPERQHQPMTHVQRLQLERAGLEQDRRSGWTGDRRR